MHIRVVRFTGVTPERMQMLRDRIEQGGGPPPGVKSTGITVLTDPDQQTAVVLQHFDTAEDMKAGAEVFSAMDPSETPGARDSVDMCEVALDLKV